jgi:hypothetical protein
VVDEIICWTCHQHGGSEDGIRRAAVLGEPDAQAFAAAENDGEERFKWAKRAAAQGDREGFMWLGRCYVYGRGCERNENLAKENSLIAAKLGFVAAMGDFGKLCDKQDPQRFFWLGKVVAVCDVSDFWGKAEKQIRIFNSGTVKNANVVFAIGRFEWTNRQ